MNRIENHRPAGEDVAAPTAVRIMDYLLGDGRNVTGDRQLDMVQRMVPDIGLVIQLNRMFMRRAVIHLVGAGRKTEPLPGLPG